MSTFVDRLAHAWNAFRNRDPTKTKSYTYNSGFGYRPDMTRLSKGNERTIVTSIYNRIALDATSIDIKHVRLDEESRYKEDMTSRLNDCLTVEANLDQSAFAFKQDLFLTILDAGHAAIVPIDTDKDPKITDAFDIYSMRVGKVKEWHPDWVLVEVYNEHTGRKEEIGVPKRSVAIVQNPFYAVMNEPNSILQRLIRMLTLLDTVDEQTSSGKLDLIIQLPYSIKSESRRIQAEQRRQDIEDQLKGSKYGIAYTDGTEKITQLNRSLENNLLKQIEYLTEMLYSQLGITKEIMDGSADAAVMTNYYSRTIEPLIDAVVNEMIRKFLTKTARSQKQSIMYFRDPFKLIAVEQMAELADKLTRNEILTSNEIRQKIGFKPSSDPKADQLINSNISMSKETEAGIKGDTESVKNEETNQNGK